MEKFTYSILDLFFYFLPLFHAHYFNYDHLKCIAIFYRISLYGLYHQLSSGWYIY